MMIVPSKNKLFYFEFPRKKSPKLWLERTFRQWQRLWKTFISNQLVVISVDECTKSSLISNIQMFSEVI